MLDASTFVVYPYLPPDFRSFTLSPNGHRGGLRVEENASLWDAVSDALGLERNRFETGVVDPDSVANTERLTDYPDYPTDPEDALEG